jgi:hypothetical protein
MPPGHFSWHDGREGAGRQMAVQEHGSVGGVAVASMRRVWKTEP